MKVIIDTVWPELSPEINASNKDAEALSTAENPLDQMEPLGTQPLSDNLENALFTL